MPESISFGELDFNLTSSMKSAGGSLKPQTPFHILLMGDFSGRESRCKEKTNGSDTAMTRLRPILVDRDNIDTVLDNLDVIIHLPIFKEKEHPLCIPFSELDDFHPDSLYQSLSAFQALKDTRKSLKDPVTFAAFTEAVLKTPILKEEAPLSENSDNPPPDDLLDQIIEGNQPEVTRKASTKSDAQWDSFLHEIVKPHLVPRPNPRQEEMIDAVDAAASELMQTILHHKAFQDMEAAWKGLYFLVSRLETNEQLKLFICDVTKAELSANLMATDNLCSTGVYKTCVEQAIGTDGRHPWAIVAGNYTFEKQLTDIAILGRMAKIANAAGSCFVAAAGDKCLCENSLAKTPDPDEWHSCEDQEIEKNWQTLREIPEAVHLGLGLPRLLMRLPYGIDTDPIDAFEFEEMQTSPLHRDYLWGNPSFAVILLLGQTFSKQGWDMQPGSILEIDSLPFHIYKEEKESRSKPCAEICLSQHAAEQIFTRGLMPLLTYPDQDKVRLGRFQSIADPLTRLAGPWR